MDSIESGITGSADPEKKGRPARQVKRKSRSAVTAVAAAQSNVNAPGEQLGDRTVMSEKVNITEVASSSGLPAGDLERDKELYQQVGGRTTLLMSISPERALTRDEAMNMSTEDIAAIGAIHDLKTRMIALVAIAESRKAQPLYKEEFDRQAGALAIEAEATATLMASPRSAEDERTYWLAMRRREASAQANIENTIELTASRSQSDDRLIADGYARLPNTTQILSNIELDLDAESNWSSNDSRRLCAIVTNAEQMGDGVRGVVLASDAMTTVVADLAALRSIQSAEARRLALLVIAGSKRIHEQYRIALATQAPDVAVEAYAIHTKQESIPQAQISALGPTPATSASVSLPDTTSPVVDRATLVPDAVAERFTKVNNHYFLPNEKIPAFVDGGTRLATRGENRLVIGSLVQIAKVRGWNHVTVGGTEEFRRAAWLEASLVGIKVDGYQPSERDLGLLAAQPARNSIAQAYAREKPDPSTMPMTMPEEQQLTGEERADLHTKAASFANDKPSFVVKKYPDLAPAYGTLSAAAVFAAERLPGNEERFAKVAKQAIVEMIARGQAVPAPELSQGAGKSRAQERGGIAVKGDEPQRAR
jgi:hypothetical protein